MVTFKEYVERIHKPSIPKVLFGIERGETLFEEIHIDHYSDYIGPEENHPLNRGFRRIFRGMYSHPDHPGKTFVFHGTNPPTVFDNAHTSDDEIMEYEDARKREARKHLYNTIHTLNSHYDVGNYSQHHIENVDRYTSVHSNINNLLLRTGAEDLKHNHGYHDHITHLDSALSVKHTPDDMVVYSGTNEDHAKILRNNSIIHHPSYISSSIVISKAAGFARSKTGDVVKIHVPKGHPGLFPHEMSQIPSEFEFILPRDTYLHIDHTKRHVLSDDLRKSTNGVTYVHHATIVHKDDLKKYE